MSDFAASLRRLREHAQLTQEELAERAGVSTRTISDAERGLRSRVYADTAGRLADALQLDGPDREAFVELARGRTVRDVSAGASVPHPLTPIVGRAAELARVTAALVPGTGSRLVTITGLGGCGKTRLAVAAAHQLSSTYEGRVWFVPLVTLQRPELLMDAIAAVFGTVPSSLSAALGHRPALVLLDGFEHVLPAAGRLEQLLHEAAGLHALVTSRVPLRIVGEREVPLGPLSRDSAAQLFLDRARDLVPDVAEDPAAIAEICTLTSGLPLPIELAAAHVRYLPVRLLRDQLRSGLSDVDRVVQDAVAWSVASLSEDERRVLSGAALFVAGCSHDALRAVCRGTDVVSALGGLADRSLVGLQRTGGAPRWRMLDVVREVVGRPRPIDPATRAAYTDFYLHLLKDVSEHVGHEDEWYRMLADEEPNIRTALVWADGDGDTETLLALATGMWLYWQSRGALEEGRRWLTRGLAMDPPAGTDLRRDALWGLGWLAYHQGDDSAAAAAGDELVRLADRCADHLARRNALTVIGMVAIARDQADEAVRMLTQALDIARGLDRPWILATSLLNLALGQLAVGSVAPARSLLGEAVQRYEAIGDRRFHARCIGYLGLAALLDGDPERARALFRQSLNAFRDLAEPAGTAEGLAGLAAVAAASGQATKAATLAGAADRLRQTVAARELPLERGIAARYLGAAAEQIGRASWDDAWRLGGELTMEEAVAQALGEAAPAVDERDGTVTARP